MNARLLRRSVVLLVLSARLASAQEKAKDPKPASDETPRLQETVDVEAELPALPPLTGAATRLPASAKDLPFTLSVVPASLVRDQDAFVLNDALKNASGVNVSTGFGVFDYFTMRGLDSLTGGLVLNDGVSEPESTFYPMYNVRQVEVLKGPASFLYGANPLAGVVQLVRKQPMTARFGEASFAYGRFGTYAGSVDGNVATSDGKVAFRLNGTLQGTDNYRDLPSGKIGAINPALLWRPDGKTRLLFSYEYMRSEWPPDTGLPFVGTSGSSLAPVERTQSYQSPFDSSTQDVTRLRFDAERQLSDSVTLRNRFYFTELEWDSNGTLILGTFDFPGGGYLRGPHPHLPGRYPEAPGRPARAGGDLQDGVGGARPARGRRDEPPPGRLHPGRWPPRSDLPRGSRGTAGQRAASRHPRVWSEGRFAGPRHRPLPRGPHRPGQAVAGLRGRAPRHPRLRRQAFEHEPRRHAS